MNRTGRLVEEGETVTDDGVRLLVEPIENNRILEVRSEPSSVETTAAESQDGA